MATPPTPAPGEPAPAAGRGAASEGPILLVEDDARLREQLARALRRRGYEVLVAGDFEGALAVAREHTPTRAVLDQRLPGGNGLDLLERLLAEWPALEVVILTGYGSISTAVAAVRRGARNYLAKPVDADDVLAAFGGVGFAGGEDERQVPSLERTEWEHIQRVLTDCDGNVSEAARRLGIHRRSLQRKIARRAPG